MMKNFEKIKKISTIKSLKSSKNQLRKADFAIKIPSFKLIIVKERIKGQ